MELFGDILVEKGTYIDFPILERIIKRPYVKPRYRLSILNPDESINHVIPNEDIPEGGITYSEEYQNGQRRSLTVELINITGKYTPSINGIWLSTKFRFDIGVDTKEGTIWFPKGIYVMGDVTLTHDSSSKTVSIQLKDKFAIYEDKMGTLEDAYEIPVGSSVYDVLKGIRNFSTGDGSIFDTKEIIMDPSFYDFKTQSTIRIDEGGNLGQVIEAIATQLSAEYYYNNLGNLCFYPINETVDDSNKPVIWVFENLNRELHNMSLSYKNEDVVNVIKVVGDNVENGVYSAVVTNENPASPICIQQVGRRIAPTYNEANIWSDEAAEDLARYYLRQASFVAVDFTCDVGYNPLLSVNNICEVESDYLKLYREKLLITSISFNSQDGKYSLKLCNTKDLPFTG